MGYDKATLFQNRVSKAIKEGASYSDIYIQSSKAHSLYYRDGKIEELSSSNIKGSGLRIINNGKTYYSHISGIDSTSIDRAYVSLLDSALNKKIHKKCDSMYELIEPFDTISSFDKDILHSMNNEIRKNCLYVRQVSFQYFTSKKKVRIISPNGITRYDERDYCCFAAQVIIEKRNKLYTGMERKCFSVSSDKFWENNSPFEIANKALQQSLLMSNASASPTGKMRVLFAGEAGGTILHEACGHSLEADIVNKDHSIYKDRIGEVVANEKVTVVDDPTIPNLYGSYTYDDEGTPAKRNILIKNGVLKKYLTDVLSSTKYGIETTGNGRRESYKHIPVPRMSNTFILQGNVAFDSMLEQTENGIYVKKMGGGEVDPTSGDFVFNVLEGYIIKSGSITEPIRATTLAGNGPSVLKNILELGDNLVLESGVCGKSGQNVPVTDGQPSMLVKDLTIGGSEV